MQTKFYALLFDTRSIQRYIYSGNRLSTNIGASYIVDKLFENVLVNDVLKKIFTDDFSSVCKVEYIGGGNALLSFKVDRRREVVSEFTRQLLIKRPGLKVGVAYGELNLIDGKLNQSDIDNLYAELKRNQNKIFPAVNVPYTGLTLSCEINGEAANFCDVSNGEVRFYSQEAAVKFTIAEEANEDLKQRFKKVFAENNNYKFPMKIDELGQKDGENYFAIIHVDGNNMGLKFRTCSGLSERRKLSQEIKRKVEGAFGDLLFKIIQMKKAGGFEKCLSLKDDMLPIRPLIIGGDDVTFLCPANMAIIFTKTLMELMSAEPLHIDCCGGVAILPTAYPFFRGYELAEQLCDSAKKSMRLLLPSDLNDKENLTAADIPFGSSWLDYAILHGEQAPTLEQIRAAEYRGARGNLHFGPYQVANFNSEHSQERRKNIENLLSCASQFKNGNMAKNKVKELRGILQHGKDDTARFLRQLHYQGQDLPDVPDWNFLKTPEFLLWTAENNSQTPYVDAIELTDFYNAEVAKQWQNLM